MLNLNKIKDELNIGIVYLQKPNKQFFIDKNNEEYTRISRFAEIVIPGFEFLNDTLLINFGDLSVEKIKEYYNLTLTNYIKKNNQQKLNKMWNLNQTKENYKDNVQIQWI